MSPSVQDCSTCGAAIPDADLESGAAIALLGKKFCASCKGKAVKDVSLDDLMDSPQARPPGPEDPTRKLQSPDLKPKPAPRPAPAKAAAPKPTAKRAATSVPPPAKTPPPRKPTSTARHRPPVRKRSSAGPIIAIAAIAVVAIILTVIVISVSKGPEKPPPDPGGDPPPVVETREQKAKREFARVQSMARSSDFKFDDVLAAIEKARPACADTVYAARLDTLKADTLKGKAAFEAEKKLESVVAGLKKDVDADTNFRRYKELMERFRIARETASRTGAKKLGAIQTLQSEYSRKYEDAAAPFYAEINQAATALSREGRYDDALAQINRFPAHLRLSGAWSSLQRLKVKIEDLKKRSRR